MGDKISALNTSLSSTATALKSSVSNLNTNLTGVKNRLVASDGLQFKFGVDSDGYYGYYDASGELMPFASSKITNDVDWVFLPDQKITYIPLLKKYSQMFICCGAIVGASAAVVYSLNGIATTLDSSETIGNNSSGWGLSLYKKSYDFQLKDVISFAKGSQDHGGILFLGGNSMVSKTFGTSDGTSHSITLTKNCNLIWVMGGTKSSYYTNFAINGVTYGPGVENIGGQTRSSTTGWGLSAQYIMGDFKKGDVFTFNRAQAAYGAVVIY